MRICGSFLHSREEVNYDKVIDTEVNGNRTMMLMEKGEVVISSSIPLRGCRVIISKSGFDSEWGVPVVSVKRVADTSLFSEEDDDGGDSGRMTGVVENVGHGKVSVGGRTFITEDDGFLSTGMKISYVLNDNVLEVVDILESGVRVGSYYKSSSYSAWPDTKTIEKLSPREKVGVSLGMNGDILIVRAIARSGLDQIDVEETLKNNKLPGRLATLGAVENKTENGLMWKIDLSKRFEGDKGEGILSLVHLAGWISGKNSSIPKELKPIFDRLRSWIRGI